MNLHEIKAWTTDQLEEHFTNVSLWELAVREIARRERVGCAKIEAGSPGSSAVFLLDGKYVVKIFPPEHAGDADVEAEVLNALAQDAVIPAPRLHSKDTDPILQWPYLLMDCVSGVALRDLLPDLDDKELERLADEIGAVVHAMHQLGDKLEPALSRMGRGWSDTLTEMEADRSLALKALRDLAVHTPEKGWVEEVAVALESEWNACLADPGVLVHRDLTADHFYLSIEIRPTVRNCSVYSARICARAIR
jgi:hygromycin-B 7''-O-kinase